MFEKYLDPQRLLSLAGQVGNWIVQKVLTVNTLVEVGVTFFVLLLGLLLARPLKKRLEHLTENREWLKKIPERLRKNVPPLVKFIVVIVLLQVALIGVKRFELSGVVVGTASRLLTAWVIIRFSTSLLKDSNWSRLISTLAWSAAALHILNLLGPTINLLDQLAIQLGDVRVSVLLVVKAVVIFTVLLKLAFGVSVLLERRLMTLDDLTPSVQVLLSKALKVTLLVVAVVATLGSLGIDLSAFAFVGGAIGVGIGFGLQKVVSNLISGIILLLDKSIKPGDVIEVGDSYGRIHSLGARYVSVVTRDGFEYLIPNEDLITHQVINWSFSNKLVRIKIGVGVSYDADVHRARELVVEAAKKTPRVLAHPGPVCQLKSFGNSSLDLELRIWISDPEKGVSNVGSEVRLAIWDAFQENDIEIPFPQRDVHIKSAPPGSPPAEG
ncbi:MAG: mechanosensitive ion channel family protein [Desulfococcaceae bacterium]